MKLEVIRGFFFIVTLFYSFLGGWGRRAVLGHSIFSRGSFFVKVFIYFYFYLYNIILYILYGLCKIRKREGKK